MCFGFSKEPSRPDGSFEYPQHMFWLRNKKNNFQIRTLILGPVSQDQTDKNLNKGFKFQFSFPFQPNINSVSLQPKSHVSPNARK